MTLPTTEQEAPAARRKREKKAAADATPEPAVAAPIKQRRRPALIGLGVALIALGGVGAAYLATSVSDTQEVIAIAETIPRGTVITAEHLTTANITSDPSVDPVSSDEADAVIGQYARWDLVAGSLLTDESFTSESAPTAGESLVGVAVTSAQLPAVELQSGDRIRIVNAPKAQDNPPKSTPDSILATVVSTKQDPETGMTVVDVVVPENQAADLAARVATQRIQIVLLPPGEEG